jgi:predicted phage terminase large subunit-like protein
VSNIKLVQGLSNSEAALWRLLEKEAGPDSLYAYLPLRTKGYERPEHLEPLVTALFEATTVGDKRVLCSVPPRHGKTELLIHFIPWFLGRYPNKTLGYATYSAELAVSKSKRARDIAVRSGILLREDSKSASEWRTKEGGGLIAAGVGGKWTGYGVDILLVDDPYKNRVEAESQIVRDNVHEWLTSSAFSRVEPSGSVIIVHARWHDDDTIGRLCVDEQTEWQYINLPAFNDNEDPLWPTRWTAEALDKRRRLVGPYDWASLYQGQPRPRGGRLFATDPARYTTFDIDRARLVIACDPAVTERTTSDYSAIVVMATEGYYVDQVTYILDVYRQRVDMNKLVAKLYALQQDWGAPIVIEAVGAFKSVAQSLHAIDPRLRIVEIQPLGSKMVRSLPVAAAWRDNRVRLPMQAEWLKDFLREVQIFTGIKDAHDDQVDAMAHGFNFANQPEAPLKRGAQPLKPGGFG